MRLRRSCVCGVGYNGWCYECDDGWGMVAFTNREQAAARAEGEKSPSGPAPGDVSARLDSEEKAFFVRSALALALLLLSSSAMNTAVFPLFDGVFTYARDVSVFANAVFLVAVGLWASFSPGRLRANTANAAAFVLFLLGGVLLPVALALENAALLVVSSCVLAVARGWASLCVGLFLSRLSADRIVPAVVMAFLAYCIVDMALWFVPGFAGVSAFIVCAPVALALSLRESREVIEAASEGGAPADMAITQPSSFLPLAGTFFVCLFLFRIAFGYSLRFFEHGGVPLPGFVGAVPVVFLAAAVVVFSRGRFLPDLATQLSVLLVLAGFFVASGFGAASAEMSVGLLSAGNTLFDMVAWSVLASVAMRNVHGSMAVIAWGRGVSGIGTIVGAAFGVWSTKAFADNEHAAILVAGAFVLLFVGYALIGLKDFSFAGAVEGVVPLVEEPEAKTSEEEFEERCAAIGDRCGLTPREREVFAMLARGRNREYIQEQLVVSRNTVKAHVKHVYAKLGIHTHQELLDMVEGNRI